MTLIDKTVPRIDAVSDRQDSKVALPDLVLRYLERNVSPDPADTQGVRFTQVGEMQLKPGRWLPFRAEQQIAVDGIEFVWRATFRPLPLVSLRVCDWCRAGAAGLDVRLWVFSLSYMPEARTSLVEKRFAISLNCLWRRRRCPSTRA